MDFLKSNPAGGHSMLLPWPGFGLPSVSPRPPEAPRRAGAFSGGAGPWENRVGGHFGRRGRSIDSPPVEELSEGKKSQMAWPTHPTNPPKCPLQPTDGRVTPNGHFTPSGAPLEESGVKIARSHIISIGGSIVWSAQKTRRGSVNFSCAAQSRVGHWRK